MKLRDYINENKELQKPLVIVSNSDGDWEGIYVKGKDYYQNHNISVYDFIKAAEAAGVLRKNSVGFVEVDDMKGASHYPKKLTDLEL